MGAARDDVREFTEQLLRTGLTLVDVLSMLLEDVPDDAFPGEEPGELLVEMLTGTLRSVAEAAGERALREATALLVAAHDRAMMDLRAPADLASRR